MEFLPEIQTLEFVNSIWLFQSITFIQRNPANSCKDTKNLPLSQMII